MSDPINPSALLESVLGLIAQDIEHIKQSVGKRKLDHDTALDLTRYSKALMEIKDNQKEAEEDEVGDIKKLTDEQLYRKAAEAMESIKNNLIKASK